MTTQEIIAPDHTLPAGAVSEEQVQQFAGRLFGIYTGAMLTAMIDIGYRTGLFEAMADGPGTSAELAARAGVHERYVREWLGSLTTSGIVDFEPAAATYTLPAAHAISLTGGAAANLAPISRLNTDLTTHVAEVARAFVDGGGVPYETYRPEFTASMDTVGRGAFDEHLVDHWVPLAPGLVDRLTAGARVADIACGTGHALVLLATRFPNSTFVGIDFAEDAIGLARAEAAGNGLANVTFEVGDVADFVPDQPFDVILVFDAIHDQVAPAAVLARICTALAPDGMFFMKEPRVSSELAANIGNPLAPIVYGVSTLHCLPVSLVGHGAGLGTAWGEQVARRMLREAGFAEPQVWDAVGDPMDAIFVTGR